MGLNLNLSYLFDAPEEIQCPNCREQIYVAFDDCEIFHDKRLEFSQGTYCQKCEKYLSVTITIRADLNSLRIEESK